jgi:hypothetical protein
LSDGLTSTIPAGTILEFTRPEAPIVIESLLTTVGSISEILIENGGTGFNDGDPGTRVFNNILVSGGTQGTGAKDALMDITVVGGVVTLVTVVNPGASFQGDFQVLPPSEIGTAGSGLILRAKVTTEDKLEGDITIDVQRATSDTLSSDEFGTVGVSRYKKTQFILGDNGSVQLNVGIDSGLDADLLDGKQGSYYRDADNINAGRLKPAYLSGEYTIDITGESGNTATLSSQTGSLNNDLLPFDIRAGATIAVRQNSTNQLLDPATKETIDPQTGNTVIQSTASDYNTVLSIRGGGTSTTNQYGGVLQLGFTDGNNVYVRGSNGSVASNQNWTSWGKIWSSQNDYNTDPANSSEIAGPNAYRLRSRTGKWYQNANTFIYGDLADRRLPTYQTKKDFNQRLRVLEGVGTGVKYDIYISEVSAAVIAAFDNAPFTDNPPIVKILDALGNDPGQIRVTNITVYNIDGDAVDTTQTSNIDDYSALYAIVTGSLETGGNFESVDANGDVLKGVALGDDVVQIPFSDYAISSYDGNADDMPDGNIEVIRLESNAGESLMVMGRSDGQSGSDTTPQIWFRSSDNPPSDPTNWYNSGFKASGGGSNVGSGNLDVLVASPDAFTIGQNKVWNEGNTLITVSATGSTYTESTPGTSDFDVNNPDQNVSVRSLVMRDENGDFNANVITASLTGLASLNLPLAGGTLDGPLQIGDSNGDQTLDVYGDTTLFGNLAIEPKSDGTNTDFTVNTDILHVDGTDEYVGVGTSTPGVKFDVYQYTNTDASDTGTTLLRLTNNVGTNGTDGDIKGTDGQRTFIDFATTDANSTFTPQVRIGSQVGGYVGDTDGGVASEGNGNFVVYTGTGTDGIGSGELTEKFRVGYNGNVGVNNPSPAYKLDVTGDIYADTTIIAQQDLKIGLAASNQGAPIYFLGATGGLIGGTTNYLSNFRVGNQLSADDVFEITAGDHSDPNNEWKATPALAIQGTNNRVAINTTVFGGTDPEEVDEFGQAIQRTYTLNIGGDININGLVFQNNAEFVTSRWTESENELDIYRNSKVWINPDFTANGFTGDPTYDLQVGGGTENQPGNIGMTGSLYVNDNIQWIDVAGIIKVNKTTIDADVEIPANVNAQSAGPLTISANVTVDVLGSWSIV